MISTHPSFYLDDKNWFKSYTDGNRFWSDEETCPYADKENKYHVVIGNDVWIGKYSKIKCGVTIGDGVIIATGSMVTKDIPPYAIVGGIPAKIIRYRFSEEEIEWLMNLKWWDKDEAWIKRYGLYFHVPKEFINQFSETGLIEENIGGA